MKDSAHKTSRQNSYGKPYLRYERGGVLIEFALLSLVFYVLVALVVDFGRMMFIAQTLQDAARVAARELAVIPLPANITFEEVLNQEIVQSRIFNTGNLVMDITGLTDDQVATQSAGLPIVNQMLAPLMITERLEGRTLIRYPGALLGDSSDEFGEALTVGIPRVASHSQDISGETGVTTIEWIPVLEEIAAGSFTLASTAPQPGLAAVRINYPFQAAMMTGFLANAEGPFEPTIGTPILADDEGVVQLNDTPGTILPDGNVVGTYSGPYGLGRQLAFAREVRPYRKLLSAQAIYRREVFQ